MNEEERRACLLGMAKLIKMLRRGGASALTLDVCRERMAAVQSQRVAA